MEFALKLDAVVINYSNQRFIFPFCNHDKFAIDFTCYRSNVCLVVYISLENLDIGGIKQRTNTHTQTNRSGEEKTDSRRRAFEPTICVTPQKLHILYEMSCGKLCLIQHRNFQNYISFPLKLFALSSLSFFCWFSISSIFDIETADFIQFFNSNDDNLHIARKISWSAIKHSHEVLDEGDLPRASSPLNT